MEPHKAEGVPSNTDIRSSSTSKRSSGKSPRASAGDNVRFHPDIEEEGAPGHPESQVRPPKQNELILYYYPRSYFSQVALFGFYLREIPFTPITIDMYRGDQFNANFLKLNPRGEVPTFHNGAQNLVLTDILSMLHHLNDDFPNAPGVPLVPTSPPVQERTQQIAAHLRKLKVESLTYGSVFFEDLPCQPKGVFANDTARHKMRHYIRKRRAIVRTEAKFNPEHADHLLKKLQDLEKDWHFLEVREDYVNLLDIFQAEMDVCERELGAMAKIANRSSLDPQAKPRKTMYSDQIWLSPEGPSIADIFLAILLWRLNILGYYHRMIAVRPHLKAYFHNLQEYESFRKAVGIQDDKVDVQVQSDPVSTIMTRARGRSPSAPDAPASFPWWAFMVPFLTMAVYGTWGYVQGPSPRRILIGPKSILSWKIAKLGL